MKKYIYETITFYTTTLEVLETSATSKVAIGHNYIEALDALGRHGYQLVSTIKSDEGTQFMVTFMKEH